MPVLASIHAMDPRHPKLQVAVVVLQSVRLVRRIGNVLDVYCWLSWIGLRMLTGKLGLPNWVELQEFWDASQKIAVANQYGKYVFYGYYYIMIDILSLTVIVVEEASPDPLAKL